MYPIQNIYVIPDIFRNVELFHNNSCNYDLTLNAKFPQNVTIYCHIPRRNVTIKTHQISKQIMFNHNIIYGCVFKLP